MYVISKHMMTNAFKVSQIGYIKDPKLGIDEQIDDGGVVVQAWYQTTIHKCRKVEFKKCKIAFNIRYPIVIYVVYKR